MSKNFSPEKRLQELTAFVSTYSKQVRFNTIGHKSPANPMPFDYISYCSQAFLSGALPNAATLFFIAFAFDKYIRRKGDISLDEAFGLKSISGVGNPAKQYARQNHKNLKLFEMAWMRAHDATLSIEKAAGIVCMDDAEEKESATLAREYKRKKWSKVEESLRGK